MKISTNRNKRKSHLIAIVIVTAFLCYLLVSYLSLALEEKLPFSLQIRPKAQPLDLLDLPLNRIEFDFEYMITLFKSRVADLKNNIIRWNYLGPNIHLILVFDENPPFSDLLTGIGKHKEGDNWVIPCIIFDEAKGACLVKYEAVVKPDGEFSLRKIKEEVGREDAAAVEERIRLLIRHRKEKAESGLSPNACKSSAAVRQTAEERQDELRPPFRRDTQRIKHSLGFARLWGKTQVLPFPGIDYLTRRSLHVEVVSDVAKTIGENLGLNIDLIEAIAYGHDLGHVPFGHVGEKCLSQICKEEGIGVFVHNAQSVRLLLDIEDLNLTLQVVDGIIGHNGEILSAEYRPSPIKTWDSFMEEYRRCFLEEGFDTKIGPMTLEGCVVRISDVIGYIGKDIEDAIRVGIIKRDDMPSRARELLGTTNREIMNALITDLIVNSYGKGYLTFSQPVFAALKELMDFNYKRIYLSGQVREYFKGLQDVMRNLFRVYKEDVEKENRDSAIYRRGFIDRRSRAYKESTTPKRMIIDFIAGMTDDFFVDQVRERLPDDYQKYFAKWFKDEKAEDAARSKRERKIGNDLIYGISPESILDEETCSKFFKTGLLSWLLSKNIVLAFDTDVPSANVKDLTDFLEILDILKKDPFYRGLLKNLEIVRSTAGNMEERIQGSLQHLGDNTEVFVFANLTNQEIFNKMKIKTNLVYIDEGDIKSGKAFPQGAYYPILEIIAFGFAQFVDENTIDKISPILPKLNIDPQPKFDPQRRILIFTLLPDAEHIYPERTRLLKVFLKSV